VNRGTRSSLCGECNVILHFPNQLCIASKLVCSLLKAIATAIAVAVTSVLSAKVADVLSGEIGRSAVNSR
jgi:hypothetical protein